MGGLCAVPATWPWLYVFDVGLPNQRREGPLCSVSWPGPAYVETRHRFVAAKLPEAAELCGRRETPILEIARSPDFSLEKLKAALKRSAEIH